jgi:hypothetical protein
VRLVDLAVLYFAAGVACAVALYRRSEDRGRASLVSALTAVPLWPLWAPIAWTSERAPRSASRRAHESEAVERIRAALVEAVESIRGTPFEPLLGRDAEKTIVDEAERVSARSRELGELLAREEFDLSAASRKLESLERSQASPRVCASARLHVENVRRLRNLRDGDVRALDELSALVVALRTELMVAKLSGSSGGAVDDIVGDLWAHIEGLRQASEELSPPRRVSVETSALA